MVDRGALRSFLPEPVRRLPADLAAVVVVTLLALATVFVPVVNETPLRVVFGLGFVLFLPGYAFIAALFPEAGAASSDADVDGDADAGGDGDADIDAVVDVDHAGSSSEGSDGPSPVPGTTAAELESEDTEVRPDLADDGSRGRSGIDGIERVALSFGLSIAIVPLIGLVLNVTPWGIRLVPVTTSVAGFTLVCVAVAARRRWALPENERFTVPYRDWIAAGKRAVLEPDDASDVALNVALALAVLLAVGSVGYAIAVPPQGERFTEFYLLTEDDDGELVADGYPETVDLDGTAELIVGLENNEHTTREYTVVVQLQEVVVEGNSTTVIERDEIDRFGATLDHDETHHERHTLRPTMAGEELRVQYLLYIDDVPDDPTRENAYRDVHLWIDVT